MAIGNWGATLIFETSDRRILTFEGFKRKIKSDWATHSRIGKKDQSEFLRAGLQSVSFDITLLATLGVKPRRMLEVIERAVENGEVATLVIGGRKVGRNRFAITDSSEAWDVVMDRGELVKAKVSITLTEYL